MWCGVGVHGITSAIWPNISSNCCCAVCDFNIEQCCEKKKRADSDDVDEKISMKIE